MIAGTYHELALRKLVAVFGRDKAERLMRELIAGQGITEIATPTELLLFSQTLKTRGGFESTVGAMLSLDAVMAGAGTMTGESRPSWTAKS